MRFFTFNFWYHVFENWYAFYIYSTSQFRPDTFQVLICHVWLVPAVLESAGSDSSTLYMCIFLSFGFLICTMEIISISMGYYKNQIIKCMWTYFVSCLLILMIFIVCHVAVAVVPEMQLKAHSSFKPQKKWNK